MGPSPRRRLQASSIRAAAGFRPAPGYLHCFAFSTRTVVFARHNTPPSDYFRFRPPIAGSPISGRYRFFTNIAVSRRFRHARMARPILSQPGFASRLAFGHAEISQSHIRSYAATPDREGLRLYFELSAFIRHFSRLAFFSFCTNTSLHQLY